MGLEFGNGTFGEFGRVRSLVLADKLGFGNVQSLVFPDLGLGSTSSTRFWENKFKVRFWWKNLGSREFEVKPVKFKVCYSWI